VGEEREREERGLDFAVVVVVVVEVEKAKLCAWVDADSARSVSLVARRSVYAVDAEGDPFIGRADASVELRGDNGDGCIGV
jgi:hypothetical protein